MSVQMWEAVKASARVGDGYDALLLSFMLSRRSNVGLSSPWRRCGF